MFAIQPRSNPILESAVGLVSRVSPVQTAMRNCTRDEGGPFEVGNQVLISSHRKLLCERCGNAGTGFRQARLRSFLGKFVPMTHRLGPGLAVGAFSVGCVRDFHSRRQLFANASMSSLPSISPKVR